jgi:hypothetical protein
LTIEIVAPIRETTFKPLQITYQKNYNYNTCTFNEITNETLIPLQQQVKKSQLQHVASTNPASLPPALNL